MKHFLVFILLVFLAQLSYGSSTVGISTHPLIEKSAITTEFAGNVSSGGGMGLQARYFRQMNREINFDAGVGIANGERQSRIFAGADWMIFPDYGDQPRTSLKGFVERTNEFDQDINSLGIAPTISKGFLFWGKEAFPFLALPTRIRMNSDDNSYQTAFNIAAGITGHIPIDGYRSLIANFETNLDINNSYTSFVLGLSMPIN